MPQQRKHKDHAARQAAYRARCADTRQQELQKRGLPHLPAIATLPGVPRWNAALQSVRQLLEQVCEEMQTYYEERSESWQESDRGESSAERQETIAALVSELELLIL
jgi:hypothetical protein